jgi:hypothetical protein
MPSIRWLRSLRTIVMALCGIAHLPLSKEIMRAKG